MAFHGGSELSLQLTDLSILHDVRIPAGALAVIYNALDHGGVLLRGHRSQLFQAGARRERQLKVRAIGASSLEILAKQIPSRPPGLSSNW